MNWYYKYNGDRKGPISASELRQMAADGRLTPDDEVWRPGLMKWIKASAIKGITFNSSSASNAIPDFEIDPQKDTSGLPANPSIASTFSQRSRHVFTMPLVAGTFAFALFLAVVFCLITPSSSKDDRFRGRAAPPAQAEFDSDVRNMASTLVKTVLVIVLAVGTLAFYLLPTIIAYNRGHQNSAAIAAVNILLGFTFLGWVAALVWALTEVQNRVHRHYHYPTIE